MAWVKGKSGDSTWRPEIIGEVRAMARRYAAEAADHAAANAGIQIVLSPPEMAL